MRRCLIVALLLAGCGSADGSALERSLRPVIAGGVPGGLLGPLRLTHTSYVPGPLATPHVHGYSLPSHQGIVDASAEPRDLEDRSVRWAGASGAVVSSAGDLLQFFRELLQARVLPRARLHEMETIRGRYGLGLAVYPTPPLSTAADTALHRAAVAAFCGR